MELSSPVKGDSAEEITAYDEVPYESQAFFQTHPDRLATMATIFGMTPAPVKNCRVLELGCASGGNIIPMAYVLPDSHFVGVDFSRRQIDVAKGHVEALGLKNLELKQMNILDVDKKLGTFDYIIAHGIFSWVPQEVQEKMFSICQELLAPQGVAYISYNTYPGWHFRGMIRDMMLYHTKNLTDPQMRAQQARALLDFLAQSVPTENNAYGIMLKAEVEVLRNARDAYFLHDHLEVENEPIYFHEFAERAAKHGMQYLGEADFSVMLTGNLPKNVDETLRRISNEIVRTEQYMDFVRNRTFRQTLMCRQDVVLNRNLGPQSVMSFYVGCPVKKLPENVDLRTNTMQAFEMANGMSLNTANPIVKAAFQHLAEVFPQTVKFDELVSVARGKLSPVLIQDKNQFDANAQLLGADLLTTFANNMIFLRTEQAPFVLEVTERPTASALVRHQAKTQEWATNQFHETLNMDIFIRNLVMLLDGSRDREQLIDELVKLVQAGTLVVHKDGQNLKEGPVLRDVLKETMENGLKVLAMRGVLIA